MLLPCLFFWPAIVGQRVLLPLDDLLQMQPWRSLLPAIDQRFVTPHNGLILDMIIQNLGWKRFLADQLHQGHLPLWNPYLLGGAPFLAAGQYQALYPFGLLFAILPVAWAYGPYTALHFGLAGVFSFIFLRLLGEHRPGAMVGAIAFAFCASLVTSVVWPQMVGAMVWLPAVLAAIELVLQSVRADAPGAVAWPQALVWTVVGAVVVALQILAGHLEISFYVLSTAAGYALWRLAPPLWRRQTRRRGLAQTGLLLALGLLGVGLAGVQLLPFAEAIRANFREGTVTVAQVRGWALPLRQLVTFLIPDFFGNPAQHRYLDLFSGRVVPVGPQADGSPTSPPATAFWGVKNYVEAASYVGLLPLLLAPLGLAGRRNRYAGFFAVAAALALLLAFGSPLYGLLFRVVPGFSQVHTAFRWIYVYEFCLAMLAGMGANWLLEAGSRRAAGRAYGALALLAGMGAAALAFGVWLVRGRVAALLQAHLAADAARPKDQWFLAGRLHDGKEWLSLVWAHGAWAALVLLLSGALLFVGLTLRPHPSVRRLLVIALPALVALDLFVVNGSFNTLADPKLLAMLPAGPTAGRPDPAVPGAIAALQVRAAAEPLFRIASFGPEDVLAPNNAMLYGLQDVRGYDTIVLKRYADFLNLIEPQQQNLIDYSQTSKTFTNPATLRSPLFHLLGVRYVLSTGAIDGGVVELVYPGPVKVYAVPAALPRAFVVPAAAAVPDATAALARLQQAGFDPARQVIVEGTPQAALAAGDGSGSARILRYAADSVTLDVDSSGPGYLVLADTYFPGWTARVRPAGNAAAAWQAAAVLPADEAFRAIRLQQGHWSVEFHYQPLSFRTGLVLSSLSAGVLALLLAVAGWGALGRRLDWQGSAARRVAKNVLSPMLSNFTNKVLDFGFNVFTAALIGPAGIGRYAEAVAVVTLLSTIQDFGLGVVTVRDVAADRALASRYFKNTLLLRLGLAALSLPVVAAITAAGSRAGAYDHLTVLTLWLLVAGFFPGSIAAAASATLKASERFEAPAFVEVAGNLVRIFVGTITLLLGWNVVGLAATSLLVNVFNAVALGIAADAVTRWRAARLDAPFCRRLLRDSFTLMVNNLLNLVFFRIDVILLTFLLRDQSAIGYYSVAYKFIDGLGFISAYLTGAIFPVMARLARGSLDALRQLYLLALRLLIAVALPVTTIVLALADRIIALFYPQFGPSIPVLRILILFLAFSYVNGITQYALIAVGKQRRITIAFVAGVVFNIVANVIFIPRYGIQAAAWVTVLSELVLLGPFLSGMAAMLRPFPAAQVLLRPALAAAGTGAIAWALRDAPWALLIPACLLSYPALLLLSGGLTARDRREFSDLFARRQVQPSEAT